MEDLSTEKDPYHVRCVEFGRRNFELRQKVENLRFSRMNYMVLSLLGWALFVIHAVWCSPK